MAITYTAPDWNKKYLQRAKNSGIETAYNQQLKTYKAQAEKNRATQIGDAQKNQQSALRQAYVQKMQNAQALNQSLATSGIRGGATETANLGLMNQYGTARQSANSDYSNSVNSINQNIDQNIADYTMDIESRKAQAVQDQANAMWSADREDSLNEYNAKLEYWNNYYTDFYSGYSKKNANKAYKKLKSKLAKAKGTDKIRIQMAIRGVKNRLGVIANK